MTRTTKYQFESGVLCVWNMKLEKLILPTIERITLCAGLRTLQYGPLPYYDTQRDQHLTCLV